MEATWKTTIWKDFFWTDLKRDHEAPIIELIRTMSESVGTDIVGGQKEIKAIDMDIDTDIVIMIEINRSTNIVLQFTTLV